MRTPPPEAAAKRLAEVTAERPGQSCGFDAAFDSRPGNQVGESHRLIGDDIGCFILELEEDCTTTVHTFIARIY